MGLSKKLNFASILVYLYLAISVFLTCYTFYRAEIVHSGNQFSYYYKYYLMFIFGNFFWIIILFLNDKKKIQIIIIISSLCFVLYFYETVRFFKPSILKSDFFKVLNKENVIKSKHGEKSKYETIQDLKINKGLDVVPSIFPSVFLKKNLVYKELDIFPLGGVSNKITVFCKEGEQFSIYKSDRYGFNNPDKEWDQKRINFFLVGDSFAQGSCVQPGEDMASQIRLLTNLPAISLGMAANGPLIELATLKEYIVKKNPQIVLWLYFERNDLDDLKIEKSNKILLNYLKNNFSQNLISKQFMIDKKLLEQIKYSERILLNPDYLKKKHTEKFLSFKKIIRLQIVRDKMALDRGLDFGIDPLFKTIMLNAKDFISKFDGQLYFIYLPDKERYTNQNLNEDVYLKKMQVLKLINDINIPIIDIHKKFFTKQNDPLQYFAQRIYGHYSPKGYNEISKVILKEIENLNINKQE